jgi:hypothetical protein
VYKLTLSEQAQVLTVSLPDLVYRFLARPPLLMGGGAEIFFFGARTRTWKKRTMMIFWGGGLNQKTDLSLISVENIIVSLVLLHSEASSGVY